MTKIRNWLIGIAAVCLLIGSMLLLPWGKDAQKVYAAEAPAVSVRGDLNADGVVNLDDVIILRQYLAGMIELTDEQIEAGDVYGSDAEITLDDVIVMRQYLAGIQVEGGIGEPMEHVHTIVYHEGKPATCTEAGWEPYETCTECDYTTYQEIAPLEHDLIEHEAKPATCTEAGWEAYVTCTRCDYTTYQEIAPLEHDLIEHEAKPATCTEPGWEAYVTCTRCDYTTYQEISVKGHSPAEVVRENEKTATCTEAGSYDEVVYCSACGIELSREAKIIAKLDHDLVEHEAKPATCTEPGWEAYVTCTRCDYTTYQEIAALDHAYEEAEIVTEPTCESDGVRKLSCVRCGDVVQEAIPAIDHNIQNNECTMCGRELPGYYNGTYGYEFLGTMDKGGVRQSLYEDIDVKVKSFHVSTYKDAPEDLILASIDYGSLGLSADEAISVWKTYKDDNPLYYWLSNTTYVEDGGIVLLVDEAYAEAEAREDYNQLIDAKVQEYSAQLYDGANAYDIALAYHDAILYAVDYTYNESNEPEGASWAHNVLGVFAGQGAVCEAYARTFQLLLNYSGIENVFVTGDGNGEEHAWNLVRLDDDNWYWCDLTWDDTFVGGLNSNWKWGISYNYFMVNDTQNTLIAEGGWVYDEEIAFLENHTFDAATNVGVSFLYDLPTRGQDIYTSGSLMLRDEIVVDDMLLQVVGYNALELHKVTASGSFDIPEAVQYNGREMRIISLGSGDSEQISDTVTSITIPESVIFIWDWALRDEAIGNIYVDVNNLKFTSQDGVLFTKSLYTLIQYPSANIRTEYVIPDETHILAYWSFDQCANLSKLTFGKNVEGVWAANWGGGYSDGEADGFGGSYVTGGISGTYNALTGDRQIIIDSENKSYASDDFAIYDYSKTAILYIYNKSITSYCVPATITYIESPSTGSNIFSDCTMLESFTVEPGHPTFSAYDGILYNKDLTEIVAVPKAIKGDITISESVTSIGDFAFYNCSSLTNITLPEMTTSIGQSAFLGCNNLTSITIPKSVQEIGAHAFGECYALQNIIVPEGVREVNTGTFSYCSGLTSVILPSTIQSIGDYAFEGCINLQEISIPSEVLTIGDNAFSKCVKLNNIIIPSKTYAIGNRAFSGCASLVKIDIPDSVISLGSKVFEGCSSLKEISFGDGVTQIEEDMFYGSQSLQSVEFGIGIKNIGDWAFRECINLEEIVLPDNVVSIGSRAFDGCSALRRVVIGEGITVISDWAFNECSMLETLSLGSNVITIEENAFSYCFELSEIEFGNKVTTIEESAFLCCDFVEIKIPGNIKEIGKRAFNSCRELKNVIIEEGVQIIGDEAFISCSINEVLIPASVITIGENAFGNCMLEKITVSEDNLNYSSFQGDLYNKELTALIRYANEKNSTNFVVPDTVITIHDYALQDSTYLETVILPNDLIYIGSYAFADSTQLREILIPDSVEIIGNNAFSDIFGGGIEQVIFENVDGWLVFESESSSVGTEILNADLSDPAKAAELLTSTYCDYYWKKH